MTSDKDPKLALFELYLATAEKVGDRRAQANSWMLSVNSAIVGLYGYLPGGQDGRRHCRETRVALGDPGRHG
jgi:hypothetical protein